ncbi:metallophosphoesterase family protein [Leptolyngbya sp. O-77]|uniref:metallophosphoesterase family protein n=1 Tax=Leptolyngbya sp. O-77 TaxID=1080068 RepID=UPI00074D3DAE|nr:metallophosphoesterase [Leptolyngbya sp. O-77]BAU44254.1 Calcineurin-like phosphoesterase [Leptolyngbya sp. O-77]
MNLRFWRGVSWRTLSIRWGLLALLGLGLALGLSACQPRVPQARQSPATQVPSALRVSPPATSTAPADTPELPVETQAVLDGLPNFPNPPRGDVRLVVISDLNESYGSTSYSKEVDRAIALVPFWRPDLVLCGGDMIAGQKATLPDEAFPAMWQAFDQHVAAPLRRFGVPFGFTLGNHDASNAQGAGGFRFQRERDAAAKYWQNPAHNPGLKFGDRADYPFSYSFTTHSEKGDVFFLVWDGSGSKILPETLQWAEQALSSEAAQSAQLRIVLGHLPLYGIAQGRDKPGEVLDNADLLRSLLEKYNVHTYISGHHHAYYPAHRGKLQLLYSGLLGSGGRVYIDHNLPPRKTLTVVDINFNNAEKTTYTTYDMETFQVLKPESLPRFLVGHNGLLLRRDVKLQELTAAEKSLCITRLGEQACAA